MQTGTVLFVSHDTVSIRSLCNRAIWIDKGQMITEGSPKDVCERYLEAFFEAQQGKVMSTRPKADAPKLSRPVSKDPRTELINSSTLRNDLRIFEFDPDAQSFGTGAAKITSVQLISDIGDTLNWIVGGEPVRLRIAVKARQELNSPIIGFFVKDKLGQTLFGDNTFLTYRDAQLQITDGEEFECEFAFNMPLLPKGDYSIQVAIATGTQEIHVQHDWIHDALIVRSESTSVASGLVGIPMTEIFITSEGN